MNDPLSLHGLPRAGGLLLALLVGFGSWVGAEDWPQWRGPRMDGTSTSSGLPTTWSRDLNVLWRRELPGPAASTPVVWSDRIFLTSTSRETDELLVLAFDRSGEEVWRRVVEEGEVRVSVPQLAHETSPASPSPVTDGEHLWVLFGTGTLACLDLDGALVWKTDLAERYGRPSLYFGLATSPLLHRDRLFLQLLHDNAQRVVALEKGSGEEAWSRDRPSDARAESVQAYTTPLPFRPEPGAEELILIHGADYLTAHRYDDGAEVWRFGTINPADNYNTAYRLAATPVVAGPLIVVPTAQRGPVFGLRPGRAKGRLTVDSEEVAWTLERANPDVPAPLVHDGLVYLVDKKGVLRVHESDTGRETFAARIHEVPHRASPVVAEGRILLAGTDGTVTVLEPGPRPKVLARNGLDERLAASPAISEGVIYLRTYEALYAIAEPRESIPSTSGR